MVLYGTIWYRMVLNGHVWYCIVQYSPVWSRIAGVNILHKWVKLFPDGNFQAHKLFPEIMRKLCLFTSYFTFILRKF